MVSMPQRAPSTPEDAAETVRPESARSKSYRDVERNRFVRLAKEAIDFRDRLREAVEPRLPPATSARSFARFLGVDKSFGWSLFRAMNATDAAGVMAAMPGRRGVRILKEGLRAAGCDPGQIARVIEKLERLHESVGDRSRPTADLLAMAAGSLDSTESAQSMARLQRQGFETLSRLRGASIDARVVALMFAPSAREGFADFATLTIQHRIRRFRPGGIIHVYSAGMAAGDVEAFGEEQNGNAAESEATEDSLPMLVRSASSPDLDDGEVMPLPILDGRRAAVADPDVERSTPLTVAFAEFMREAGPVRRSPDALEASNFSAKVSLPVPTGRVIVDVWMERSLPPVDPQAGIFLHSSPTMLPPDLAELTRFPSKEEFRSVRRRQLPEEYADAEASYRHLTAMAAKKLGVDESGFRLQRLEVAYPPPPSSVLVRWRLPA